jgi:hypothetical protein
MFKGFLKKRALMSLHLFYEVFQQLDRATLHVDVEQVGKSLHHGAGRIDSFAENDSKGRW